MASGELLKELNDQFNYELLSGYAYIAMSAYCKAQNMNGFSHFFVKQAQEEYEHAMKFYDFIYDMDGRVATYDIPAQKNDFDSILESFEVALGHERKVTSKIHALLDRAHEEKCYATVEFLQWFVKEQVEEENSMKDIIEVIKGIDGSYNGMYLLDKELGKRA